MSATKELQFEKIEAGMREAPVNFYGYIIKGVYNVNTDESGWRIVGLWGDEENGEGNRIGPTFP